MQNSFVESCYIITNLIKKTEKKKKKKKSKKKHKKKKKQYLFKIT